MLTLPSPPLANSKKNWLTSWTIMLSSGSGLPNNWHKSHKRFGYVNLRSRISRASKPPTTVPFGHLYTAGIERASCSTLRSFLLNLCRKVVRFGELQYHTFVITTIIQTRCYLNRSMEVCSSRFSRSILNPMSTLDGTLLKASTRRISMSSSSVSNAWRRSISLAYFLKTEHS